MAKLDVSDSFKKYIKQVDDNFSQFNMMISLGRGKGGIWTDAERDCLYHLYAATANVRAALRELVNTNQN
jgi:hypothetical protein